MNLDRWVPPLVGLLHLLWKRTSLNVTKTPPIRTSVPYATEHHSVQSSTISLWQTSVVQWSSQRNQQLSGMMPSWHHIWCNSKPQQVAQVIWHKAASPTHTDSSVVYDFLFFFIAGRGPAYSKPQRGDLVAYARWHQCALQWAHPSPQPKWHLDWFSHFCRAHDHDRPTDHATPPIAIGYIYVVLQYGLKIAKSEIYSKVTRWSEKYPNFQRQTTWPKRSFKIIDNGSIQ